MSFEDILGRRLGPMKDLVHRKRRPELPDLDAAALCYRRAVGLEARVQAEQSWSRIEVQTAFGRTVTLDPKEARTVFGLTEWTSAELIRERSRISPDRLLRFAQEGLLYFSSKTPEQGLTGSSGHLATGDAIARRRSMWPTLAVETAIEIAPMPFMPRGRDLLGAELVGVRLASLERGHEVFGVSIIGSRKIGRLIRHLLPLLDGRWTVSEILGALPSALRADGERMLELFDLCTVLEPVPAQVRLARALLDRPADPQVTWLGHAGVLFQDADTSVLIDPTFFSASEPPEPWRSPCDFDERALPRIDAVLITHGDNDHLNPNSLARLPTSTPIYIPRAPDPSPPHQVDMRGLLSVLGFERVVEVEDWEELEIGSLRVTVCPFVGEDWGLNLAQQTYLIEGPKLSVYLSADSFRMDETYEWLARRERRIDLALLGVSGCAENAAAPPELGYGNFYQYWVAPSRHAEWMQHCAGPKDAAKNAAIFKPAFVFGYACGGASYIRTSYSDTGSHEELARLLEGSEIRPVALPLGEPVRLPELDQH